MVQKVLLRMQSFSVRDVNYVLLNLILGTPVTITLHILLKQKEFWGQRISINSLVRSRREEKNERSIGIFIIVILNALFSLGVWTSASVIPCVSYGNIKHESNDLSLTLEHC